VLEKRLEKTFAAIALAALVGLAFQLGQSKPAYSSAANQLDDFGVKMIYPTKTGGNQWYVDMNDPTSDPMFRNLPSMTKQSDGSWQVSKDQVRMEAWSPPNQKWLNVEMTEYAKIIQSSDDVLQMYSRGGHHSSSDPCLGSAVKARLYGNGEAAWVKELTHPAYAGNRGTVQATNQPLDGMWVGFKAVIYNFVENGKTYVRMESYIDDDVTDSNGNLVVKNNWKLASVYEDKGGWATDDSDFDSSCGRERDEILTGPGGTSSQNLAAFRSDQQKWNFKYLSVREIDPLSPTPQPVQEEPVQPVAYTPEDNIPQDNNESSNSGYSCDTSSCILIVGQHVPNDGNAITAISSVDLQLRKTTSRTSGTAIVALVKDGNIVDQAALDVSELRSYYSPITAKFSQPVDVAGSSFDIVIFFEGEDRVVALCDNDYVSGNLFYDGEEKESYDLVYGIHQSP
jgi:hypothetical protein